MAFDLDHHRTLMRGGAPCTDRTTWSWDGLAWTPVDSAGPPPRVGASMAYDPSTRSVVLVGGRDCRGRGSAESWRWDGHGWSRLQGMPAGARACLVYSAARNRMMLFAIDSAARPRAWQVSGTRWQEAALGLPPLRDASCAVDPANQRVVLVGRRRDSTVATTFLLLQ